MQQFFDPSRVIGLMNVPGASFICTLRPELAELATLADAIAAWAAPQRLAAAAMSAMTLMLEELVANSIRHGYGASGTTGSIEVRLEIDGATLVATVTDAGSAFDPLQTPAPDTSLALEDRAPGGLGVHLVRRLAHSVDYRRVDGRNVIRVTRNLAT